MVTQDFLLVQWIESICQYSGHGFNPWSRRFWCHEATKPMCHNYWVCVPQLLKPTHLEPALCNERSHQNEKPMHHKKEYSLLTATRESTTGSHKVQFNQKKKWLLPSLWELKRPLWQRRIPGSDGCYYYYYFYDSY